MNKLFMRTMLISGVFFMVTGSFAVQAHSKTLEDLKAELRAQVREEMGISEPEKKTVSVTRSGNAPRKSVTGSEDAGNRSLAEHFFDLIDRLNDFKVDASQVGLVKKGIMFLVIISLIPAVIAKSKGRSFALWWFFGIVLFVLAFPISVFIRDKRKKKTVPGPPGERPEPRSEYYSEGAGRTQKDSGEKSDQDAGLSVSSGGDTPATDVYKLIDMLKKLKDEGVISGEEFKVKEEEWLGRI